MPDLSNLSLASWAGITAAFAVVGGFWRQFLSFFTWVSSLIVCRVVVKEDAARAIMNQVWQKGQRSPFGLRMFGGIQGFVAPKRRGEGVGYEGLTSEALLFWLGRVPLLVGQGFTLGANSQPNVGDYGGNNQPVTLRYFRGTLDIDTFLAESIAAYNALRQSREMGQTKTRRFNVIRMYGPMTGADQGVRADNPTSASLHGNRDSGDIMVKLQQGELRSLVWKPEELVERANDIAPFVNHPVAPEVLGQFDEIETFLSHETWFRSRSVPWFRGYLIWGESGSGKSTIVRNLAQRHDLPIYVFDLSTYDNRSFASDWKIALQNVPAIVLLEDLDCQFNLRENLSAKGKTRDCLTFDCLLNTISGVGSSDGILLFVTTNHLDKIDPALGIPDNGHGRTTRPGRISKAVYVGPMGEPERRKLAGLILSDWPELVDEAVRAGEGETAAQFQERCAQLALIKFWGSGVVKPVEPPPERDAGLTEQHLARRSYVHELQVKYGSVDQATAIMELGMVKDAQGNVWRGGISKA